jgi:diadenosine tetraphosphatase ApaH/serine/threonine PP2A family protein phosphatase
MEWIYVKDQLPDHMQDIKVWIDNPYFGSYERENTAVFLQFEFPGSFYDSHDQTYLDYVIKWKPLND